MKLPVKDTGSLRAAIIVRRAERDLKRTLSTGERRDLLKDNTSWDSERIREIVKELPVAIKQMESRKNLQFELITRPVPKLQPSKRKKEQRRK